MRTMLAAASVVVVSAMPAVVQAQSFELGVKGGVVFATLTGGPEEISENIHERAPLAFTCSRALR